MATSADLLIDAFGRIRGIVHRVVGDLDRAQLAFRADADANSIAWLIWHLTRTEDDHMSEVANHDQAWTSAGWAERFALPFDASAIGYGHSSAEVAAVQADGELLTGYHDEVHNQTIEYLQTVTDDDLDRVIDNSWDPPVTLGVRLVSVVSDGLQHAGQAAFVRGILERR